MKISAFLILLLANTQTAWADIENPCADLWFSRNAMLDRAGYCFSSTLGKALFDNSDCTTKQPQVPDRTAAQIALIRQLEQGNSDGFYDKCHIDTSLATLDLPDQGLRKQLEFQPATDGGTGICFGYQGEEQPVYAAPWETATKLGMIRQGDDVTLAHLDWNGWSFSTISNNGRARVMGWYRTPISDGRQCRAFAG